MTLRVLHAGAEGVLSELAGIREMVKTDQPLNDVELSNILHHTRRAANYSRRGDHIADLHPNNIYSVTLANQVVIKDPFDYTYYIPRFNFFLATSNWEAVQRTIDTVTAITDMSQQPRRWQSVIPTWMRTVYLFWKGDLAECLATVEGNEDILLRVYGNSWWVIYPMVLYLTGQTKRALEMVGPSGWPVERAVIVGQPSEHGKHFLMMVAEYEKDDPDPAVINQACPLKSMLFPRFARYLTAPK